MIGGIVEVLLKCGYIVELIPHSIGLTMVYHKGTRLYVKSYTNSNLELMANDITYNVSKFYEIIDELLLEDGNLLCNFDTSEYVTHRGFQDLINIALRTDTEMYITNGIDKCRVELRKGYHMVMDITSLYEIYMLDDNQELRCSKINQYMELTKQLDIKESKGEDIIL